MDKEILFSSIELQTYLDDCFNQFLEDIQAITLDLERIDDGSIELMRNIIHDYSIETPRLIKESKEIIPYLDIQKSPNRLTIPKISFRVRIPFKGQAKCFKAIPRESLRPQEEIYGLVTSIVPPQMLELEIYSRIPTDRISEFDKDKEMKQIEKRISKVEKIINSQRQTIEAHNNRCEQKLVEILDALYNLQLAWPQVNAI